MSCVRSQCDRFRVPRSRDSACDGGSKSAPVSSLHQDVLRRRSVSKKEAKQIAPAPDHPSRNECVDGVAPHWPALVPSVDTHCRAENGSAIALVCCAPRSSVRRAHHVCCSAHGRGGHLRAHGSAGEARLRAATLRDGLSGMRHRSARRAEPSCAPHQVLAANDLVGLARPLDYVAFGVTAIVQAPAVLKYQSIEPIRSGPRRGILVFLAVSGGQLPGV
jgi:hypothetical protein